MTLKLADRVKKLKEIKGITLAAIGLAAGVLCLFISSGGEDSSEKEGFALEESSESTLSEYAEAEEQRVCALLNAVDGVRSARVLLTFESGSEYVYDTGGYSRNEPLLLEEHPPKVCGAAVVCVGGNDPDVKMKVIDLLCSLYGISSSRVSVAGSS